MKSERQPKVLVVDDDDTVRESFRHYLEDNGYAVSEAADGREGLEVFEAETPDIVLVDLRMPEMNGLQVMGKISEKSPDTPLIVVSATGRIDDAVEALHLGAWDYLLKPVTDLSIIGHSISKALERTRLLHENRDYQQHLEEEVDRRTGELMQKVEEMSRFNRMAVGRERRIIELKRLANNLLAELGREPRFKSPGMLEEDPSLLD